MAFPSVTYTFTNGTTADATQVNQNYTDLVNGFSDGTKSLNMSAATFASTVTCNGAVNLGAGTSNDITVIGSIAASIPIKTNTSFDFGSSTLGLRSVYIGGSSTYTTRIIGGTQAASITLTLPTAVAAVRAPLVSDTSGTLYWAPLPTIQKFTSGTGTYTTPSSPSPRYIRVKMVGGGGGGAGSGTSSTHNGSDGNDSTFGTSTAAKGLAGLVGGQGGAGGTATLGSGHAGNNPTGGSGQGGNAGSSGTGPIGGQGAASSLGGSGGGGYIGTAGQAGKSGGGGGGAGGTVSGLSVSGGGGGAGGYIDAIITAPSATYSYAVGAGGAGGAAGINGFAGGNGGDGIIIVEEFY